MPLDPCEIEYVELGNRNRNVQVDQERRQLQEGRQMLTVLKVRSNAKSLQRTVGFAARQKANQTGYEISYVTNSFNFLDTWNG